MSENHSENTKVSEASIGLQPYLLRFVAVFVVLLVVVPLLPVVISNLSYSFSGQAPKIYWYLSRSAGFVALSILWVSMALGLGITNKIVRLWPGVPTAFALHEYVSLLGLGFAIYHALILMGDHFVDFSLPRLLTPFSIDYEPLWVGLGQVGFYVWLIAALSFYVRRFIGQKTWRLIHYVNFATYMMGLFHGLFSGTDSTADWAQLYYWASGGSLLVLLAYRVYDSALKNKFSLPKFLRQPVQNSPQVPITSTPAPILSKVKNMPEALLREQARSPISATDKPNIPATIPNPVQIINENSAPLSMEEKTRLQTSEKPAIENQPTLPSSAPAAASTAPAPEVKATSPAPVVKLAKTSNENKVKVRIFKEPTTRPILELQKEFEARQIEIGTLFIRLKENFHAIPVEPTRPNRRSRQIVFSED
jgi:hypothetical protein